MTIPKINIQEAKQKTLKTGLNMTHIILISTVIYGLALSNSGIDYKPKPIIAQAQTLTSIDAGQIVQTAEIEPLKVRNNAVLPPPTVEQVKAVIGKNKTPITPERWIELSNDLDIPLDFLLTVAFQESHFGTKGRAVETQNIFNVGNTDCGDGKVVTRDECNRFIESWEIGVLEFSKLIKDCYFYENEEIKIETWIDRDFKAVRCEIKGKRYMSDKFSKFKYKTSSKAIQSKLVVSLS
jgi:hypothetical protein